MSAICTQFIISSYTKQSQIFLQRTCFVEDNSKYRTWSFPQKANLSIADTSLQWTPFLRANGVSYRELPLFNIHTHLCKILVLKYFLLRPPMAWVCLLLSSITALHPHPIGHHTSLACMKTSHTCRLAGIVPGIFRQMVVSRIPRYQCYGQRNTCQ